ncbi:hypothetical protein QE152_g25781 [Popillia japonica]|uniref:Transposase n=1 Tax=Popillia japonica TaxID=7064 RepID=A0AAW1JZX5_POPJA
MLVKAAKTATRNSDFKHEVDQICGNSHFVAATKLPDSNVETLPLVICSLHILRMLVKAAKTATRNSDFKHQVDQICGNSHFVAATKLPDSNVETLPLVICSLKELQKQSC